MFAGCVGVGLWLLDARVGRSGPMHPSCGHCGYDLTGSTSNRCPECGRLFIDAGVRVSRPRRSRLRIAAGIMMLLIGVLFLPCLATTALSLRLRAANSQLTAQRLAAAAAAARAYEAELAAQQLEHSTNDDSHR